MINNQNFIFFNIHKSATSVATAVDLNKSNRVATGNRLSRLSRDWSVVCASITFFLWKFLILSHYFYVPDGIFLHIFANYLDIR